MVKYDWETHTLFPKSYKARDSAFDSCGLVWLQLDMSLIHETAFGLQKSHFYKRFHWAREHQRGCFYRICMPNPTGSFSDAFGFIMFGLPPNSLLPRRCLPDTPLRFGHWKMTAVVWPASCCWRWLLAFLGLLFWLSSSGPLLKALVRNPNSCNCFGHLFCTRLFAQWLMLMFKSTKIVSWKSCMQFYYFGTHSNGISVHRSGSRRSSEVHKHWDIKFDAKGMFQYTVGRHSSIGKRCLLPVRLSGPKELNLPDAFKHSFSE